MDNDEVELGNGEEGEEDVGFSGLGFAKGQQESHEAGLGSGDNGEGWGRLDNDDDDNPNSDEIAF